MESIENKIGQMLVFGWCADSSGESDTINEHAFALIDEFRVGGVILMSRNATHPGQVRRVTDELQSLAADRRLHPLFVSIDQEGGAKTRLRPPHFRVSREAWDIGEEGDLSAARTEAWAAGCELLGIGINWNFAPVLDVNNNPANPVIGRRSYSDDPRLAAAFGVSATRGYQEDAGVMACGKHFPGHGDTNVDSHEALPVIEHSLERLRRVELVPFKTAIDAGIAGIMSSHILFPALDSELPATLSPRILTGLLREELGFRGLVITDCLEMRGVADHWGLGEAAVLSVEAGADLVLCCHTRRLQREIVDGLLDAVHCGRLTEARIDESLARIERAKSKWASPALSARAG